MATEENKVIEYPELRDMPRISISEAYEQVMMSIKTGQRRGCLTFVGEAGIGKTQFLAQAAEESGYRLLTLRLSQWNMLGCGIPSKTDDGNFFKIVLPDFFPKPGEKVIINCDEINRAKPEAFAMLFSMIEDGKIFDYVIPENCLVTATMNPEMAAYSVMGIFGEPAVRRRMKWFWVITSYADFMSHAKSNLFHANSKSDHIRNKPCYSPLIEFLEAKPALLYDAESRDNEKLYACPASWETVSEDLYGLEIQDLDLTDKKVLSFAKKRISATLGCTLTNTLMAHLIDTNTTINAHHVLTDYKRVQKKIAYLCKEQKAEPLTETVSNVLSLLFSLKPEPSTVAINIEKFLTALPIEIASGALQSIKKESDTTKSDTYLKELMACLSVRDSFIALVRKANATHNSFETKLKAIKPK